VRGVPHPIISTKRTYNAQGQRVISLKALSLVPSTKIMST